MGCDSAKGNLQDLRQKVLLGFTASLVPMTPRPVKGAFCCMLSMSDDEACGASLRGVEAMVKPHGSSHNRLVKGNNYCMKKT